jgi:putative nucleotidyltransferase with HDIG domain
MNSAGRTSSWSSSVTTVGIAERAAELAEHLVAPLGRRWKHVQAVAACATNLADAVSESDRPTLIAAAWLHDIGYAADLAVTGFHPLDGARHLREHGWPTMMVNLVAHHSAARYEAVERVLEQELSVFPFSLSALQDALDTADLTTGPAGEAWTFDERMDEIMQRYPPNDPVHRFWLRARAIEGDAVERTMDCLRAQPK